jgi:hypothetical protein
VEPSKKDKLILVLVDLLLTAEVLDGFLLNVFSRYNLLALFVSQEITWWKERITPKFSFHTTQYAQYRPNVLGSSLAETKDYNGQTYWLSVNLHSSIKAKNLNGLI